MKKRTVVRVLMSIALVLSLLPAMTAYATEYITYYSPVSFSGTSNLALNGSAQLSSGALYLTTSGTSQAGSAFFMSKVKQTDGFSTYFNFTLANRGGSDPGADGIVFIIAASTNSLGAVGEGIGYSGITNSVGIEFDTYPNLHDVSGNHIGINLNGNLTSDTNYSGYSSNVCDLGPNYFNADGPFYVWIDYVSSTKLLSIYISTSSTRPTSASLSKTIDLSTYCGNEYYVGFTAATGGDYEQHKINKWYFKNSYVSGGLVDGGDYATDTTAPTTPTISASGTTVTIAGSTDTGGSGVNHYEYQINGTGGTWSTYSSGIDISSYSSVTVYARAVDNVGNISSESSQVYSVPVLSSVSSSSVGNTSATLSGSVTSGSSLSALGFKYSSTVSTATDLKSGGTEASVPASVGNFSKSLTGLTPGTTYYYLAYATNSQSTTYSSVYSFTTTIDTPTVTPSVTTSSLTLNWNAVTGATGYMVRIDGGSAVSLGSGTTSYEVTGLGPNTSHAYSVVTMGEDTNSSAATGTKYTLAAQPSVTAATQKQDGSVVLTINTASNSIATTYLIEKSQNSDFLSNVTTVMSYATLSDTAVTVPKSSSDESVGVLPATTYFFRVTAKNGDSVTTTPTITTTGVMTVPEIPAAPTLTATETSGYGEKQLALDWADVTGATSYDVYSYSGGTYTYLGTTVTSDYTDENLTPNTQYTYAIASRNVGTSGSDDDGRSVYSTTAGKYTLAATPDVDTVTANADGSVSVTVDEQTNPTDTTYYYVQVSQSGDFSSIKTSSGWVNPGSDHLTTITGLDRGTTYYFRVKAENNESTPVETAYGDIVGSVTTIPADVGGTVTVTATGTTSLSVSWPSAAGATSYDVYYSEDGSSYTYLKNVADTSTNDTDFKPNTGRYYKIIARSSSGVSVNALASTSKVYTYAVTPALTLAPQSDGSVIVTIDPKDNADGTQYYVEYGTDSTTGTDGALTAAAGYFDYDTITSRSISGLDANTVYYFHVKAKNGVGVETSYSSFANVLTAPATPVISSADPAVSGTTHSVTVEWASLGTGITYNVYRSGTLIVTTSGTSYKDSGLKANKFYQYTVAAVNDGGEGAASSAVSARTLAEYPDAVTASAKTASSFTITLTPSFLLAEAEQYQVTLKTSDGTTVTALSWSSDLSYQFSGLSSGTQYAVSVNVRNSDGIERDAKSILTLYTNRAVNGEITNDTADVVLENVSSSNFAIQMKLWDPDGDKVTATAAIGGITRTVTITAPTSEPDSYNAELVWDADTLVEGTYSDPITVTVTDGNDSTITLSYDHDLTVDKTAPVITLTGDATVYLEVGDTYTDDSATVTGDDGNGVSADTTSVDTGTAGTYTLTYTSTDDAGNTATATRTVIVVAPASASTVTLTIPETGIGATSAVLDGAVTTLGKLQTFSDHGFVWSTEAIADGTDIGSITSISLGSKSNLNTFNSSLTGLSSGTYYVRPYVEYDGTIIYGNEVSFTTADTDTDRLYLSPTAVTRTEGDSGTTDVTFTVSRLSADMSASVDVQIDLSGSAEESTDYTTDLTSDTVTIGENETSATFTVSIIGNTTYASDKTVVMTLGSVTGYIAVTGNDSATLTIANDDAYVASSDATISGFTLGVTDEQVSIDSTTTIGTISITVPYGTDVSSITPAITLTDSTNASVTPTGTRDFSVGTVAYTVTAEDGTTKRYEVTVTVEPASTDATLSSAVFTYGGENTVILTPGFDSSTTNGYVGDVSSDTTSISLSAFTNDDGATTKIYLGGAEVDDPSDISLAYGDNTITVVVTAEDGSTKTYTFIITRAAAGTDSNADLVSIVLSNGTLNPDFDKDTTEYNVNVAYSIHTTAVTVTLSNSGASYTITANGTATTAGTEAGLNVGANVFVVTVTATDGTVKTYSISVSRAKASSSSGGGGSSTSSLSSASSHVPVIVNGTTVSAGTQTSGTTSSGATITTVIVDTSLVDTQLSTAGSGATVTVPVSGDETIKAGVLTGAMIKQMEDQGATLQVTTGGVTYVIPADEINVEKVVDTFGSGTALSDINITVQIESLTGSEAKFVADTTASSGYTLVLQPVTFTVTAEYSGTTVEIDTFNNYVQRLIAIPDYISADKITTAVVVTSDGTSYHVPTEVREVDGIDYAVINSLTNSTYALIYNSVTFSDTVGHWAEAAISDMGSRTVVSGVGNNLYEPDRSITRAEFAVIIVRALGLDTGMGDCSFTDVSISDWFYGYVQTAVGYGLISGYPDGTFGPNDTITREQAMTMVARAMEITGLAPTLTDSEVETLLSTFADVSNISSYAKENIAACVDTGVVLGRPDSTIAAADSITRAEVAVIIERLLQNSDLI